MDLGAQLSHTTWGPAVNDCRVGHGLALSTRMEGSSTTGLPGSLSTFCWFFTMVGHTGMRFVKASWWAEGKGGGV